MKKTIHAVAALTVAASIQAVAEGELQWNLLFTGNNYSVTGAQGQTYSTLTVNLGSAQVSDGVCTTPGNSNRVRIEDSDSPVSVTNNFSLVVQGGLASTITTDYPVLFGFGLGPSNNFKVNANRASSDLGIAPEGYALNADYSERGGSIAPGMCTYIVTYTYNESDKTASLTLYQDAVLVASALTNSIGTDKEGPLDYFTVGGRPYNTSNLSNFSFTNMQLYSGVLTQEQILTLSPNATVPEPATATLSLLALAGLCARRRRK